MTPEKGFYYHYKHDPEGSVNNYAYEVLNIAHHTEVEDWDENAFVIYCPIYESTVYKAGKHWDARPLKMFMENVENEQGESLLKGGRMKRFTRITDEKVIAELEKIKKEMYGI